MMIDFFTITMVNVQNNPSIIAITPLPKNNLYNCNIKTLDVAEVSQHILQTLQGYKQKHVRITDSVPR